MSPNVDVGRQLSTAGACSTRSLAIRRRRGTDRLKHSCMSPEPSRKGMEGVFVRRERKFRSPLREFAMSYAAWGETTRCMVSPQDEFVTDQASLSTGSVG